MPFRFERLEIPDVVLIEPRGFEDARGFFMETYRRSEFEAHGVPGPFVQDNYSFSVRNVLRGLHYQKNPSAQAKLVMVVRGSVFDVAVDLRRGSPTFGKWVGQVLTEENRRMLYVPVGFAHGFCVLSKDARVLYKVTAEYDPDLDGGVIWNEPEIGIRWPIEKPILSEKDSRLPRLSEADHNFEYGRT